LNSQKQVASDFIKVEGVCLLRATLLLTLFVWVFKVTKTTMVYTLWVKVNHSQNQCRFNLS
jgi:hypothetical protein